MVGRDVISKCLKFDISPRRRIEFESATVKLVRKMGGCDGRIRISPIGIF